MLVSKIREFEVGPTKLEKETLNEKQLITLSPLLRGFSLGDKTFGTPFVSCACRQVF